MHMLCVCQVTTFTNVVVGVAYWLLNGSIQFMLLAIVLAMVLSVNNA